MKRCFFILIFVICLIKIMSASQVHAANYSYYRSITVTSTSAIASGTNTNFPFLFSGTYTWLESSSTAGGAGRIQNLTTAPNGGTEPADLTFATSSANCNTNSLNFEIESYVSSTGAINDWVNVPSLSTGTVIYACYGDSSTATDQSHPSSTWNSNYGLVLHFPTPTSTLTTKDSTVFGNNSTNNGPATSTSAGQIDGAAKFIANAGDYDTVAASSSFEATSSISISFWINGTNDSGNQPYFFDTDSDGFAGTTLQNFSNKIYWSLGGSSGNNKFAYAWTSDNNWHYFVTTYNGSTMILYIDGTQRATASVSETINWDANAFTIGNRNGGGSSYYTSGTIDEFDVNNTALTPSWIATAYNNQNSPSTFYTVGSETSLSVPTNVSGYAWGNQIGWVSFSTGFGGLEVMTTTITGYAWSQNGGWINFSTASSTVMNSSGTLSGYAWSQNFGWINFSGVTIDSSGVFHGVASGTYAGSIQFDSSGGCIYCNVTTTWKAPLVPLAISSVNINGTNPSTITLTTNTTTSVSVEATITDNTCSEITGGTTTVLLYRSGITSSTCFSTANNLNCYQATVFTASSTCSAGTVNTTTTFSVQYFAQATDASSSYPNQNWIGTVIFTDSVSATSSADSTHATSSNVFSTLTAINVTTSSINYGTLAASSTTGSTNQTTTVANAGNSSTTLQVSGSALLNGSNSIATSSQHYATSSFTFGGSEQSLSGTASTVSGFSLRSPTSTSNVQSTLFWGLQVPGNTSTGTYSGTNTFTASFHS